MSAMSNQMDTPTIFKKGAHMLVALYTASIIRNELSEHTDIDTDTPTCQVGCFIVGHLVANQTDKVTNPPIDAAASWIKAKKSDRKAKKAAKKTAKEESK